MHVTRHALVRIGCALAMVGVCACPSTDRHPSAGGTGAAAGTGTPAGHNASEAGASAAAAGSGGTTIPVQGGAAGGGGAASLDGGDANEADGGTTTEEDSGTAPDDCAGVIVDDPGGCLQDDAFCTRLNDGRYCTGSAAPMCPPNYTPIAKSDTCPARTRCFDYSESLRCSSRLYTPEECAAAGGIGLVDPGDGSLVCPGDAKALGALDANLIEGGLCCPAVAKYCGARAGDSCKADEFCDYQEGQLCGQADAQATCKRRPSVCTTDVAPVCGCDGETYTNACAANAAGSGIYTLGDCK
jgi:hypothetical protein